VGFLEFGNMAEARPLRLGYRLVDEPVAQFAGFLGFTTEQSPVAGKIRQDFQLNQREF
jgi:hypothetical protein